MYQYHWDFPFNISVHYYDTIVTNAKKVYITVIQDVVTFTHDIYIIQHLCMNFGHGFDAQHLYFRLEYTNM